MQTWNWHFKSLVFFLKRGKQDRCIRTHTRVGTGDCWEQNKNLISLSLTCSGSGRDEESHCILYLLLSLTDAPLCAQEVHNISRECLHGYGPIIAWGTRRCKWNPRHLLCFWKGFTRMQFISTYQLICRLHCISKGPLIPKSLTKNQDKRPKACDAPLWAVKGRTTKSKHYWQCIRVAGQSLRPVLSDYLALLKTAVNNVADQKL